MNFSILLTLSTKAEETENNRLSLGFIKQAGYQLDNNAIPETDREHQKSENGASKTVSDILLAEKGIDIQIKRNNQNITQSAAVVNGVPTRDAVDRKIDKLMETYKGIVIDKESLSSEAYPESIHAPRLSTNRSMDHMRTTKRYQYPDTYEYKPALLSHSKSPRLESDNIYQGQSGPSLNKQLFELQDYNRTLETELDNVKADLTNLASKLKKEKKVRQQTEERATSFETDSIKLKSEVDRLTSRHEKSISSEKEKVYILETKIDECLQSNSDLRHRIGELECDCCGLKERHLEDKQYIDNLRQENDELQASLVTYKSDLEQNTQELKTALKRVSELESQASNLRVENKGLIIKLESSSAINTDQARMVDRLTSKIE